MTNWIKARGYVISIFLLVAYCYVTAESYAGQEKHKKQASHGKIAFSSYISGNWEIWVVNADGSGLVQLTDTVVEEEYPTWSPDLFKVAYATNEGQIWVVEIGKKPQIISYLPKNSTHPAWSPDGRNMAFVSYSFKDGRENSDIWIAKTKEGKARKLVEEEGIHRNPAWSPDGSTIAYTFAYWGNRGKPTEDLWIISADGTNPRRLVANNGSNIQPDWSSDGQRIAFASNSNGNMDIWVTDKNGINARQLTHDKSYDADPSWSPDGSSICFVSTRSGKLDIWVMDSDGKNARQLTGLSDLPAECKEPCWSP